MYTTRRRTVAASSRLGPGRGVEQCSSAENRRRSPANASMAARITLGNYIPPGPDASDWPVSSKNRSSRYGQTLARSQDAGVARTSGERSDARRSGPRRRDLFLYEDKSAVDRDSVDELRFDARPRARSVSSSPSRTARYAFRWLLVKSVRDENPPLATPFAADRASASTWALGPRQTRAGMRRTSFWSIRDDRRSPDVRLSQQLQPCA